MATQTPEVNAQLPAAGDTKWLVGATTLDHAMPETNSGIAKDSRDDNANDTGDNTAATADQDIGEYYYVLSTVAEYRTGGTSLRDESVFCSLANL